MGEERKRYSEESAPALTRRKFFAGSMAALGAVAAAGVSGCSPQLSETGEDVPDQVDVAPANVLEGGEWKSVRCSRCGGGFCVNRAYVVDGTVVRMKTDDSHEDSLYTPQVRSCMKGHLAHRYYYAPNRLNYPLKRKSWQPGGGENSHGELRGKDEWERISWDEALDLTAQELRRIMDEYGPRSILSRAMGGNVVAGVEGGAASGFNPPPLLTALGGCISEWGEVSAGASTVVSTCRVGASSPFGKDYITRSHSKLIVIWAGDYAMSSPQSDNYFNEAKKNGAQLVYVGPWYNLTSQGLADEYIPVRPGTDGAFMLGVAYEIIQNNWQDQEFLDKYCVGFDADHMPENAPTGENFKDYVLGAYDDTPKTPEWASEICGTPVETIRKFAELVSQTKPLTISGSCAAARTANGHNYTEMLYVLAWMCGCDDFSIFPFWGGATANYIGFGGAGGQKYPESFDPTIGTAPYGNYDLSNALYHEDYFYGPAFCDTYNAILTGKFHHLAHGEQDINIKAIAKLSSNAMLNQISGIMHGIEAYRSVDFVVAADIFFTTDCAYSDIVFPVAAVWEKGFGTLSPGNNVVLGETRLTDPLYERKSDAEIQVELAKRLGLDENLIIQMPERQSDFNIFAGAQALDANDIAAGMKPLLTITQEDLDAFGVEGTPQEGIMPIGEFLEKGIYQVPRSEGDGMEQAPYAAFMEDPEANPLPTATGKFEIYSWAFKEAYDRFNLEAVDPLPKYVPAYDGYEASFTDWEKKIKGEYDLQFVSVHYISQAHSQLSDLAEANEIWPNNLQMNPIDAEARGLSDGDAVLVESAAGKIAVHVTVTPRIMPGVVLHGEGNGADLDEETGVDMGANDNVICGDRLMGIGQNPWNSTLVKVSKWTGKPLEARYQRPRRPNYAEEA